MKAVRNKRPTGKIWKWKEVDSSQEAETGRSS